jgi:hypothetical protein
MKIAAVFGPVAASSAAPSSNGTEMKPSSIGPSFGSFASPGVAESEP